METSTEGETKEKPPFLKSAYTFLRQGRVERVGLGLIVFLLFNFVILANFSPQVSLKVGEKSPSDLRAPRSAVYIDKEETEKQRKQAADRIKPIYEYDSKVTLDVQRQVRDVFSKISKVLRSLANESAWRKVTKLEKILSIRLSSATLFNSVNSDPETIDQLKSATLQIVKQVMNQGLRSNIPRDIRLAKEDIREKVRGLPFQEKYLSIITEVGERVIQPNTIFNQRETQRQREKARLKVKPVTRPISLGEVIVHRDEVVLLSHLARLEAMGMRHPRINYQNIVGIAILNLIFFFIIIGYLRLYEKSLFGSFSLLVLLSIVTLLALIGVRLISNPLLSGYQTALPLISAAMLIAILLSPTLAVLVSIILSCQLGIIMNNELRFVILGIVSTLIAIWGVRKVQQRGDIVRAGGAVSLISVGLVGGITLLCGNTLWEMLVNSLLGVVNGFGASVITIGGLFFLERPFGISTPIQLLELCNPNEPLMRKLMTEAPGTYSHSIYVSNLAEAAAAKISVNTLLVQVGAYYHDLGKTKRPYFFIENQMNIDNLHQKISPALSASIIKAHVSDGVEIAKEYRLPPKVIDIIEEHHGNSLITYFYDQALEEEGGNSEQRIYRYDSRKPQTKEAALVMLADSVEAAVRSLDEPTPSRVQDMVRKVVRDKFEDGQLDECDLTLRDLGEITVAFISFLEGMFHPRVEYPKEGNKD